MTGLLALGVACTTAVHAQQSGVAEAKERANAAPTNPEAALSYGRALRRAGREADALAELRRGRLFAKDDLAVRLEWEIARTHVARRDFHQALGTCRAMTRLPGAEAASRVCAAEAHLLWRRGSEALTEIGELAKLREPSAEVRYFAKIAEGRSLELAVKETEAEADYKSAIAIAPERPEAHALLGAMLQRLGKDGMPSLKKAVEVDPRDPVAQLELGRALSGAEQIAAFERAVAERPTFTDALRALGTAYLAANRVADAKRTIAKVLELAPNDVPSRIAFGRVAFAEGRFDDAIKEGEAAFKLMPNEGKAKLLVADAYAKKGEIDLAIEAYQKAHGLDPSDPTPLVNAAAACLAAGRLTSAKAFAQRATKEFAEHGPGWVALGDALVADKDTNGARSAYESAKKARGVDAAAVDTKLAGLK
jgi:tetratricopeptide (TPR) repeat protein